MPGGQAGLPKEGGGQAGSLHGQGQVAADSEKSAAAQAHQRLNPKDFPAGLRFFCEGAEETAPECT